MKREHCDGECNHDFCEGKDPEAVCTHTPTPPLISEFNDDYPCIDLNGIQEEICKCGNCKLQKRVLDLSFRAYLAGGKEALESIKSCVGDESNGSHIDEKMMEEIYETLGDAYVGGLNDERLAILAAMHSKAEAWVTSLEETK